MFHLLSDDPDGPARCWTSTGTLIRIAQAVCLRPFDNMNTDYLRLDRITYAYHPSRPHFIL